MGLDLDCFSEIPSHNKYLDFTQVFVLYTYKHAHKQAKARLYFFKDNGVIEREVRYWRSGAKKCFDRKTHEVLAARDKSASHQPSLACHRLSYSHHLCSAALMLLAKAQCLQERT